MPWGKKFEDGTVMDQAFFCEGVAATNKLEFLKWAREVKHCEWNEWTINQAAGKGHTDILKYFVEERKISEEAKESCVATTATYGKIDCLNYLVEEAKVPLDLWVHVAYARYKEHHDCVNYLREKGSHEPTDEQYAIFVEDQQRDSEEENSD